jgi:hypothetical protein
MKAVLVIWAVLAAPGIALAILAAVVVTSALGIVLGLVSVAGFV